MEDRKSIDREIEEKKALENELEQLKKKSVSKDNLVDAAT